MKFADNRLYIADNQPQVFQLGPDMNLLGRINKIGKGPGEFTGINDMSFINDSLYLFSWPQAKIIVYDDKNNFIREIALPDVSGSDMAVDKRSHIFLSTPNREHPITEYNADGQKGMSFGRNTVGKDHKKVSRNERYLLIHKNKLIALAKSEPELAVYSLKGKLISKAEVNPPEILDEIAEVKKKNDLSENPDFLGLRILFIDMAMYKNNIYIMRPNGYNESTNSYDKKFTYLFKYKFGPDGDVTFDKTFKLFRTGREMALHGFRLAAVDDHKLIVYDLMGKSLLVFEDERL
jgi:hypothetical protein